MESKLRAISNNVNNNDTVVEFGSKIHDLQEPKQISTPEYLCQKKVPVLFTTNRGIHLRKFNKSSMNDEYMMSFCDLERWNFRNHVESIGLTPPSTSDRSAVKSIKIVQAKDGSGIEKRQEHG
ncbi:CLUMA_CG012516, isoform A [Clunio marinus]|uniref:CLUMA_CG012516, isoform A n=1 Tax=Clunio marinus TaxID=568069 RepID=A0A1J1IJD0_9DIPT|nr:CLUMA_CG012516, isoform A [Clunio marinus]